MDEDAIRIAMLGVRNASQSLVGSKPTEPEQAGDEANSLAEEESDAVMDAARIAEEERKNRIQLEAALSEAYAEHGSRCVGVGGDFTSLQLCYKV